MKIVSFAVALFALSPPPALASLTHGSTMSADSAKKVFKRPENPPKDTQTPDFAKGHPHPIFEARLANLLLQNKDAILSFPAVLATSSYKPFGNGQSNAQLTQGKLWRDSALFVYGVQKSGKRKYHFHPKTDVKKWVEKSLGDGKYEVIPEGWNDGFHFDFSPISLSRAAFVGKIPVVARSFSGGREAPNPGKISTKDAYEKLQAGGLGDGYGKNPYFAYNLHGHFPTSSGPATAIGAALSWGVTDKTHAPFQHFYSCLEARNLSSESMKGVPSGSGWHRVEDLGEAILNTIDPSPIPMARGRSTAKPMAYGLTEVITAAWVKPSQVMITSNGDFQWYVNPYQRELCLEIWAARCVPTAKNGWGFDCPSELPDLESAEAPAAPSPEIPIAVPAS